MTVFQLGDIRIYIDRNNIPQDFDAVVVVLFWADKFVMFWNPERGWEFPGGHREGKETYKETAIREVREEAQIEIQNLAYLGYYTQKPEHLTLIVCADCLSREGLDNEIVPLKLKVFDAMPPRLSFGDGREQIFLEAARVYRKLS
jgi:8-oxo-dGTP pyrophosphatase MutT (NUDIX family)